MRLAFRIRMVYLPGINCGRQGIGAFDIRQGGQLPELSERRAGTACGDEYASGERRLFQRAAEGEAKGGGVFPTHVGDSRQDFRTVIGGQPQESLNKIVLLRLQSLLLIRLQPQGEFAGIDPA
jgi:hypothetical protein